MRVRLGVSCAAVAVVSVAWGAAASGCVSSSDQGPGPVEAGGIDATQPDVGVPPAEDTGADVTLDVTTVDTGVPPVDAGVDAPVDAPADALQGVDAADVADAAPEAGCVPLPMTGYVPPPYVPAARAVVSCTGGSAEEQLYYDPCFGDAATPAGCSAFLEAGAPDGSSAKCEACLFSNETDSVYRVGVLGVVPAINLAGCIGLADSTDAGQTCAATAQAAAACVEAACKTGCPVTDVPSRDAYLACVNAAAAGGCATFANAAAACVAAEQDAATGVLASRCFAWSTENQEFLSIATWFCDT